MSFIPEDHEDIPFIDATPEISDTEDNDVTFYDRIVRELGDEALIDDSPVETISAESKQTLKHGTVLNNRYTLLGNNIGSGTFGRVWKCKDSQSQRTVAVKVLTMFYKPSRAIKEFNLVRYLQKKDPAASSKLIVEMKCWFRCGEQLCFVMELLSYNLREVMCLYAFRGGIEIPVAKLIAKQLARGLDFIHRNKIIHADFKPDNVVSVSSNKHWVKIADFGLSFIEGELENPYIQSLFYRSPEVILMDKVTTKVDIWSYACTIIEIMTHRVLFPGRSPADMIRLQSRILKSVPTEVIERSLKGQKYLSFFRGGSEYDTTFNTALNKHTPRDLEDAVMKANFDKAYPAKKHRGDIQDLLQKMLAFDHNERISAKEVLEHKFFKGVQDVENT